MAARSGIAGAGVTGDEGRLALALVPPTPPFRPAATQGLTLVYFSAQPKPFWSHLHVSPCLIDWGKIMRPTYPTKSVYVE